MKTEVDTKALQELAGKPQALPLHDEGTALALPPGWTAEVHFPDDDKREAPRRISREVSAHEIGGFISYVNRFKSEKTALYCTSDKSPSILARLDDHQPSAPSHVEHMARYGCPVTEEWGRWNAKHKANMDQKEFAEFIEDNIRDVAEPTGVEFLSAITNFRDTRQVEFNSAQRLSDGMVQFSYVEKETAQQVRFPTEIKIAVPVFMGLDTLYAVNARVKYRLKEGALTLWYELDRPDLVKREAYEELLTLVETETKLHVHRAI